MPEGRSRTAPSDEAGAVVSRRAYVCCDCHQEFWMQSVRCPSCVAAALAVSLRGKCQEYAEAAVAADPTLRLVRGWYIDPTWGRQEHWWTERPDGSIYDPTSAQFPMGGVREWYEEFAGIFPCEECGMDFAEGKGYDRCCSVQCYGRMVGVYVHASARGDSGASGGQP